MNLTLNTNRLTLIPMNLKDLAFFHYVNIDPFVREYLWDNEEIPIELSERILKEIEVNFTKRKWGLWKIKRNIDGRSIGYVGLWTFFNEKQPQL